MSKPETLTHLG